MKNWIGLLFLLLGLVVMLAGAAMALLEFAGVYSHALTDPLSEPVQSEHESADAMFRAVLIGASGFPLAVIGSVMLKIGLIKKLHRKLREHKRDERK